MEKPKLRAVQTFPIEQNGQSLICLRDPSGLAPEPVLLGMGAYFLVTLFDGANDLRDVQGAFTRRFGEFLSLDNLKELIATLDSAHFLDSPAFAERERRIRDAFVASPNRPATLAGLCYEADPALLRAELAAFYDPPAGPGRAPGKRVNGYLSGLIAPHIDPRRGGPAYAHAYGELSAHAPPELVVILGTSHYSAGAQLYSATRKNYSTPLGEVETDRDFLERLSARYTGGDLFAGEILHRNEHSIEFQALFLAWTLGVRGYQIVPILVSSIHQIVMAAARPSDDPRVASFVQALRATLADDKRVKLIIAGVDFAHVGRKFGDAESVDEKFAQRVRSEDHALIEYIKRGDPDGFIRDVARDRDARRICGLAPIYTQLELLRGRAGRLLKYDIAMEPDTGSAVSFASLAID
ncbi:MAG: AmmeMemoRadiSam system protein B [Candidatus Binataceae bacterium]